MFVDPTGEDGAVIFGTVGVVALYAVLITGIVMAVLTASGITVTFGEVLASAIDLLAEQTKFRATLIKASAQVLIAQWTINAAAKRLQDIAGKYEIGQCDKAAKEMENYLRRKGLHGAVVKLTFPNAPYGTVYSRSKDVRAGTNSFHMGIFFEGKMYCVVHPEGLDYFNWYSDFIDMNGKFGVITNIDF